MILISSRDAMELAKTNALGSLASILSREPTNSKV
jgi:hypothetical protein